MIFWNNYNYNDYNQSLAKPILKAIKENNIDFLDTKLESLSNYQGANFMLDINQKDTQKEERADNFINDRVTLLHAAAFYESLECFVFLHKQKNFNIRVLSVKSFLPLHYACFNNSREIVAYILSEDPEQATIPRDDPLINFTILGGDSIILKELFNKGAKIIKNSNDDPLEKSIALDNSELCKIILEHYEECKKGTTPALIAADMNNPKILGFLVRSSSDLQYSLLTHESVFTLIFKTSNGLDFKDLILSWLQKFDDLIIEPPIIPGTNNDGVCHWICKLGDPEIAKLMLETKEIALNRIGENNRIGPYHLASSTKLKVENVIKILQMLIDKGFDLNFQPNPKVETTLEVFTNSTFRNKNTVIEFLLNHGASPYATFTKNNSLTIYDFVIKTNKPLVDLFNKFI